MPPTWWSIPSSLPSALCVSPRASAASASSRRPIAGSAAASIRWWRGPNSRPLRKARRSRANSFGAERRQMAGECRPFAVLRLQVPRFPEWRHDQLCGVALRPHPGLDLAFRFALAEAIARLQALDQFFTAAADAGEVFVGDFDPVTPNVGFE